MNDAGRVYVCVCVCACACACVCVRVCVCECVCVLGKEVAYKTANMAYKNYTCIFAFVLLREI